MPAITLPTADLRLFVDASHTYKSGLNSGIQRVVRNVCSLADQAHETVDARTVVIENDCFWTVDLSLEDQRRQVLREIRADVAAATPLFYRRIAKVVCKSLAFTPLDRWLLPKPGRQGVFKLPLKVYEKWLGRRGGREKVLPGLGDLVLLPDAYWARSTVWPAVEEARARGAKVAFVIYDLIPVTHPQFVSKQAVEPFRDYLKQVAAHADMIVAISDTVRQQVEELFSLPEYPTECKHFASFELGAQFNAPQGVVRGSVKSIFTEDATNAPHLMVATFDPRKNHSYALDAFESVWKERPDLKLCFVGRVGWLCSEVIERVQNHARFGTQLFALHDASDAELEYIYSKARSVLMPSIVEGFGLPIVEALWHQRHVFASDTAIHREVGRDECSYFDLSSAQSLADKILEWEQQQGDVSPCRQSSFTPVSWDQSVASLVAQCCRKLFPATMCDAGQNRAA